MTLAMVLGLWVFLSFATLPFMAALCRSGHTEDLRLGYVAPEPARPAVSLPGPRAALDDVSVRASVIR